MFLATPRTNAREARGGAGLEGCAAGDATLTGARALTSDDPAHHLARRLCRDRRHAPRERPGAEFAPPTANFYVWLEPQYVHQLRATRKLGESFSEVIVRLAEASEGA